MKLEVCFWVVIDDDYSSTGGISNQPSHFVETLFIVSV